MSYEIRSIESIIKQNISSIMVDENARPYTKYDHSILQYAEKPPEMREATLTDIPKMMKAGTLWLTDLIEQFIKN